MHNTALAQENVLVIKTSPGLENRIQELTQIFTRQGSTAVAKAIQGDTLNQEALEKWQDFARSGVVHVAEVQVHPNETKAIEWMNKRFHRMGLPNLQFKALPNDSLPDPTALPDDKIRGKKWLRYLAGPGVAAVACFLGLPESSTQLSTTDYLYLIIPAAGVGVTTVALELQFAWPWLNNVFWKKVWKFGGPLVGRITNTMVNFMYGMALYGAGVGSAHIPVLFGAEAVNYGAMGFTQSVVAAAIGAVTFHIAMGQFQTDISTEEERGSHTSSQRYGLETTGVVVNNGARVSSWVLPGDAAYGAAAQGGFFLLKTLPQFLKTNVSDKIEDHDVHRLINKSTAPKNSFITKCARLLGSLSLVNLPDMRKSH